jgi:hypothetical protein
MEVFAGLTCAPGAGQGGVTRGKAGRLVAIAVVFLGLAAHAVAADVPPASEEFRAQRIREHTPACVKAIEEKPDLRARYSRKTVETYCVCRQRSYADVLALAIKNDERGKAVVDKAEAHIRKRCHHILLENLEHE